MIIYGIDPGVSGGIAKIDGKYIELFSFRDCTIQDMVGLFDMVFGGQTAPPERFVMLERVHAMPSTFRGCATSWILAEIFSTIKTLLTVHQVPFSLVLPEKWQKEMDCKFPKSTKYAQRKKLLRTKAQSLFPKVAGITADTCDALLIAEFARRTYK